MLLHHLAALAMSVASAKFGFGQVYVPFFCGVIEGSTVFLSFVQIFREIPVLKKLFPSFDHATSVCFGITFIVTRVIMWTACPRLSFGHEAHVAVSHTSTAHLCDLCCPAVLICPHVHAADLVQKDRAACGTELFRQFL